MKRVALFFTVLTLLINVTPKQISDFYQSNPIAALEKYGGQGMEFAGPVASCIRTFNQDISVWTVRLDLGYIDVLGYIRHEIPVGQQITIRRVFIYI